MTTIFAAISRCNARSARKGSYSTAKNTWKSACTSRLPSLNISADSFDGAVRHDERQYSVSVSSQKYLEFHHAFGSGTVRVAPMSVRLSHSGNGLSSMFKKHGFSTSTEQDDPTISQPDLASSNEFLQDCRPEGSTGMVTDLEMGSNAPNGEKATNRKESLDHRSEVKLEALSDAKLRASEAKSAYHDAKNNGREDDSGLCSVENARNEWLESEKSLSRAFQQAIKYTARTKRSNAASAAQDLLDEMLERLEIPWTSYPLNDGMGSEAAKSTKVKSGVMSDMLKGSISPPSPLPDISGVSHLLPSKRDFHNVLHSWASSKARKKGLYAEALLLRMAELASWYPKHFDPPDSKAFALVVKCHAGSTHSLSLKKIVHLHNIHNIYADFGVPDIVRHDPFFLMCSLKALKNYRNPEESALADQWLSELHSSVTDSESVRCKSVDTAKEDAGCAANDQKMIDLSGTYIMAIRELARLRGTEGAADRARSVLDKMHEIAEMDSDILRMPIKSNAYDLVLGSYRDSKEERHKLEAFSLLDEMIDSWKNQCRGKEVPPRLCNVPLPTEKSFAFVIQALAGISDKSASKEKCHRLLEVEIIYDTGTHFSQPTNSVYNAVLNFLTKSMANDPRLIDEVCGIMERMGSTSADVKPDATSYSFLLKAYSLLRCDEEQKAGALKKVDATFKELEKNSSMAITDDCYYHMMRCVVHLVSDENERRDRIIDLFKRACERGLVSKNVLRMFRDKVSEDFFVETVGSGRLADKWVAHVTPSNKALYTDGTTGGAGRHARRKGKSTSDWLKKQKRKEARRRDMAAAKTHRKQRRQAQRKRVV